ncbi:MAG: VOC family protein [Cyanobacteria bacterium P01_F01_bin.150]
MKIDHVHFIVDNAPQQREWFIHCLGWESIGQRQLPDRAIEVLRYRDTAFVLTSPRTPDSPVAIYLQTYSPGIVDVAIEVDNLAAFTSRPHAPPSIQTPYQTDIALISEIVTGGRAIAPPISICTAGWGRLHHTIIERPASKLSHQSIHQTVHQTAHQASSQTIPKTAHGQDIDHIVLNVAKGDLPAAVDFYQKGWGLQPRQSFKIQTEHSGLNSQVLCAPETQLYFNINEPTSANSQIQTFIEANRGAGIQHIALHSDPIVPTVTALRQRGTPLLSVPPAYYRQLEQRLRTRCSVPIQMQEWQQIVQQQILLDWQPEEPDALLLQIFSQPIFKDNHFFFEFIERRQAVKGFGEGNFLALYRAIEEEMLQAAASSASSVNINRSGQRLAEEAVSKSLVRDAS